jgi:hypothetical protein
MTDPERAHNTLNRARWDADECFGAYLEKKFELFDIKGGIFQAYGFKISKINRNWDNLLTKTSMDLIQGFILTYINSNSAGSGQHFYSPLSRFIRLMCTDRVPGTGEAIGRQPPSEQLLQAFSCAIRWLGTNNCGVNNSCLDGPRNYI